MQISLLLLDLFPGLLYSLNLLMSRCVVVLSHDCLALNFSRKRLRRMVLCRLEHTIGQIHLLEKSFLDGHDISSCSLHELDLSLLKIMGLGVPHTEHVTAPFCLFLVVPIPLLLLPLNCADLIINERRIRHTSVRVASDFNVKCLCAPFSRLRCLRFDLMLVLDGCVEVPHRSRWRHVMHVNCLYRQRSD